MPGRPLMAGRPLMGGAPMTPDPAVYRDARAGILDAEAGASRRAALTSLTDAWLAEVFAASGADEVGGCLLALGGYGRGHLSAGSDLDLLLVTGEGSVPERLDGIAQRLWYPVWDTGVRLDHSVRTASQTRQLAARDLRAALGLLDARVVTGDRELGDRVVSGVLADWRGLARARLTELRASVGRRRALAGDAAHLLEPDIKEAYGGLRDAAVLDAIAASWVTDIPREALRPARHALLDMRDAMDTAARRAGRRPSTVLRAQDQQEVAEILGLADRDALLRAVSESTRAIAYGSDSAWHRVDRLLRDRPPRRWSTRRTPRRAGPERVPLADGVVVHEGEVGLAGDARPATDPVLALRLAAAAAQACLPVAPGALARLQRESPQLPVPWPPAARDALVSLLGAGAGLVSVWEAMDQHGLVSRLIPEWDGVRSAPQRNPVHIYRVDRHLVETAAAASARLRDVARPDLLLIAALLHDIGKGRQGDHSEAGAAIAERVTEAMGFDDADRATLVCLVRHHLLLAETATRRDLEDPRTVQVVVDALGTSEVLGLLHALTYADAAATGPGAWSDWKAALVDDLVERADRVLQGAAPDSRLPWHDRFPGMDAAAIDDDITAEVRVAPGTSASTVLITAPDRPGLLGAIAGVLAIHRLEVKAADTETIGARAFTAWTVVPFFGEFPAVDLLTADLRRALAGQIDVGARLVHRSRPRSGPDPLVHFVEEAASLGDVLEVRAHDEPALLYRVGDAIREAGATITAARVCTLGSEIVDAFYVRSSTGAALSGEERTQVVRAVRRALEHGDESEKPGTA